MTEIDVSTISLRALRAVVAVADAGSFTGAALHLGLGQSAISHAIARLEKTFGLELFIRRRDGVVDAREGRGGADCRYVGVPRGAPGDQRGQALEQTVPGSLVDT